MASRKLNPRGSDRVRTRTGSANAERIRSGEVSEALTEVIREETRLPRISTQEAKDLEGEKSVARVKSSSPTGSEHSKDCPITEDPDSVAHLVRHFKPAGCPLPSLRNMTKREAYVKMVVAHDKAMKANNEFAATLEKRMQDVPVAQLAAAEKLGNQAASLEARLRVVSNERKSALEQVSFLEAKVESSANKFSDDLRRTIYDAKKALEIMNNNLLASDELLRLRTKEVELGSEFDVMAVLDFSVGKLDLPQISEDLPDDFFAKIPSAADDLTKCSGGQFEDSEFGIEE
ncbi:hypothetical protein Bca101_095984 [Brassica carinata]